MNRHLLWIVLAIVLVLGGLIFWGQHHNMSPNQIEQHLQSAPDQLKRHMGDS